MYNDVIVNEILNTTLKTVIDKIRNEETEDAVRESWVYYKLATEINSRLMNLKEEYNEKFKDIISTGNYVKYVRIEKVFNVETGEEEEIKVPEDKCIEYNPVEINAETGLSYKIKDECQELIDKGLYIPSLDLYRETVIKEYIENINSFKESLDYNEYINLVKPIVIEVINEEFNKAMSLLVKMYPNHERETWPQQKAEAEKYLADSSSDTPLLDSISEIRGIDKTLLANKIMEKAQAYETISGKAIGFRQKAEDLIDNVTDLDSLKSTFDTLLNYKNVFYSLLKNS